MKTKILLLAMIISMCGGTSDEGNEKNIISLSTTHTEIIQMLEAENQLIGVDSFSETELPIKKIDAYTCLLYTSPSPRDRTRARMPSSA